jgi:predicted tellurium resistance membrane protein TerC
VQSGIVVIGLALGFLAITPLCQYFARVHPFWPVLAGAALLVIGICLLIGGPALDALTLISKYFWPLVLVAVGSYLLWRVYHPTQRDRERHGPLHPQR